MNGITPALMRAIQFRAHIFGRRLMSSSADISKASDIRPTNFDKKLLVWFGKRYRTVQEIPSHVPASSLSEARTSFRIWMNVGTFVLALGGCLAAVHYGKRQHEQGKSLHGMALEERAEYSVTHSNNSK